MTETHRFHQGHEVTVIESLQMRNDGASLGYTQEITGPNQEKHSDEIEFNITKA